MRTQDFSVSELAERMVSVIFQNLVSFHINHLSGGPTGFLDVYLPSNADLIPEMVGCAMATAEELVKEIFRHEEGSVIQNLQE